MCWSNITFWMNKYFNWFVIPRHQSVWVSITMATIIAIVILCWFYRLLLQRQKEIDLGNSLFSLYKTLQKRKVTIKIEWLNLFQTTTKTKEGKLQYKWNDWIYSTYCNNSARTDGQLSFKYSNPSVCITVENINSPYVRNYVFIKKTG